MRGPPPLLPTGWMTIWGRSAAGGVARVGINRGCCEPKRDTSRAATALTLRHSTAMGVGVPDPHREAFLEVHAGLVTDRSVQRRQRPERRPSFCVEV